MKIYIIGIVASGKTSLAKMLTRHYDIPSYEVDVIVHPRDGKIQKRYHEDQVAYMKTLDQAGDWLVEGTYRKSCDYLLDQADLIVFLDPPLWLRRLRILTRYMKQQLKIEKCHYESNLTMLKAMYRWTNDFEDKRSDFESMLNKYKDKLLVLNEKTSQSNYDIIVGGNYELIPITRSV